MTLAVACIVMSCLGLSANNQECIATDTAITIFSEKIYFPKSSSRISSDFAGNKAHLENIRRFLLNKDSLKHIRLEIAGAASPEGKKSFNKALARKRAQSLKRHFGIGNVTDAEARIIQESDKKQWPSCRYAELTAIAKVRKAKPAPEQIAVTEKETVSAAQQKEKQNLSAGQDSIMSSESLTGSQNSTRVEPAGEVPAATADLTPKKSKKNFSIIAGTNLLYDAALIPNIGAGVLIGDKLTIWADWMYSWWSNREKRKYWRIYGGDIEARWQLGHGLSDNPLSGHRVGVYASMVTYDIQRGRSHTGIMGDKFNYAAGVSYGYSLPVARRLNIDFSIGVGYMWGRYMKQRLIDTHDVWQSTHSRRWFGPTKAEIGLIWLIGPGNVNERRQKGGDK